jgi:hypothetical protein
VAVGQQEERPIGIRQFDRADRRQRDDGVAELTGAVNEDRLQRVLGL